jgi:hypothetical protein
MGYSIHVLPEHRLGVVRLYDRVDGAALIETFGLLVHDADWEPGFSSVWDARLVRALAMSPEDPPRFAEVQGALSGPHGPGRTAVLTRHTLDETTTRVLRIKWAGGPGRQIQGFLDRADAAAWLGVPVKALTQRYELAWGAPR